MKYLLDELGWAGQENIWLLVMAHRTRCALSSAKFNNVIKLHLLKL